MNLLKFVRERLDYDESTGVLTWRESTGSRPAGIRAGSKNIQGYRCIGIGRRIYNEHRIVWLWVHGELPNQEIDHINGIRDDNRLANLRLASREANMQNIGIRRDNTSGYLGVSRHKKSGKWVAQISSCGRTRHLGSFDNPEDAHAAYKAARQEMYPSTVWTRQSVSEVLNEHSE